MKNAKSIALDHAADCGHAAIKLSQSADWTHFRKNEDESIKESYF
jgi:hypothetical protein